MHRLHKVTKAGTSAMAVRNIPWFILNRIVFSGLSLWVAFRGLCNAVSNARRRK